MLDMRIILSTTWVVVTLIYLYGDVLRNYHSGDMAKALAGNCAAAQHADRVNLKKI